MDCDPNRCRPMCEAPIMPDRCPSRLYKFTIPQGTLFTTKAVWAGADTAARPGNRPGRPEDPAVEDPTAGGDIGHSVVFRVPRTWGRIAANSCRAYKPAQRNNGTNHAGGFWKIPDEQQRIALQGAIRMRCHVPVLYLYMMDFRSQKKHSRNESISPKCRKCRLHIPQHCVILSGR